LSDRDEVQLLRKEVARLRRENELQRGRLEVLAGLITVLRAGLAVGVRARLVHERRQAGIGWCCGCRKYILAGERPLGL